MKESKVNEANPDAREETCDARKSADALKILFNRLDPGQQLIDKQLLHELTEAIFDPESDSSSLGSDSDNDEADIQTFRQRVIDRTDIDSEI